ncbi:NAD(P)-binding Rossmann-fold superfamily protein isoform 2 [Populus alba x Populus x berolinensis]|nr:NAD(P)-binding Rossmann-fold superfamily protein isoform 2 [Populus alba x Populus x berolinensis]
MIKSFCKNARKLKICWYRPIEDEFNNPEVTELQKYLTDEEYSVAMGFYILLRAVDRFAANYNSFPGQFEGEMDEDISRLKTTVVGLLSDLGCNGATVTEDLINEMCRFGASELHAVAAFIGGIASQEVIKLITKQFVPMVGTFMFNGIDQRSPLHRMEQLTFCRRHSSHCRELQGKAESSAAVQEIPGCTLPLIRLAFSSTA